MDLDIYSLKPENFHPQYDRILVKRERPNKTKGGVILTDLGKDILKEPVGVILKMGPSAGVDPDNPDAPRPFNEGDTVLLARHAGDFIKVGDCEIYICVDTDVLCVIK